MRRDASIALAARALLVLAGLVCAAGAAAQEFLFEFEQAQFVLSDSRRPPPEDAGWQPVALPDNWHASRPGFAGAGWYRLTFTLPAERPRPLVVFNKRADAHHTVMFVNERLFAGGGPRGATDFRAWQPPERYAIPPPLLRPGVNVLHVRMEADARLRQGMHRLVIGDPSGIHPLHRDRFGLQIITLHMLCAGAFLAGLLGLAFWLRERGDKTLLWFTVTAFVWSAIAWPWFQGSRSEELGAALGAVAFLLRFAYAPPMLVLCLHMAGRRMAWLQAGIWLFSAAGFGIAASGGHAISGSLITLYSGVYLGLLFALLLMLISAERRHRDLAFWLLVCALGTAVLLNAYDYGRWIGWLDFDNPTLAHFHAPLVLFALGAKVVSRHFDAVAEVERSNIELEGRIAEKAREIEANHARLREADRTEALARERQRIMTDMHDGVGASLVGLLGAVQAGKTGMREIERRLSEALQELRLAVDALEPVNGDLGAVLGGVRHRMRPAIEDSGVQFQWRVGELPRLGYLTPQVILQVQRIVLEALSNALRHAHARTVSVETRVEPAGWLEIRIADDGAGFDPERVTRGRGLGSMSARAAGIGGTLEVRARPGGATSVVLRLPLCEPQRAAA